VYRLAQGGCKAGTGDSSDVDVPECAAA